MTSSTRLTFARALVLSLGIFALSAAASNADKFAQSVLDPKAGDQLDLSCRLEENSRFDPALSASFLKSSGAKAGKVETVIGKYSRERGLLAGFAASNGKRFLIRSWWRSDGRPMAEVVHRNDRTGAIEVLLGRARLVTNEGEFAFGNYQVAGIDLIPAMRETKAARKKGGAANHDALRTFMLEPEGKALSEAIPALYVALEQFGDDEMLRDLQAPLGALLGALQMVSGVYNDLGNGEQVFGPQRATGLRSTCKEPGCKYKGHHFTILSPGIFDSVTNARKLKSKARSCEALTPGGPFGGTIGSVGPFSAAPRASGPFSNTPLDAFRTKNGDGNCTDPGGCFGMCGLGCVNPGEVWTVQCFAHDTCVCKYGQLACISNTPAVCADCGSLFDAIDSFIAALFGPGGVMEQDQVDQEFRWWDEDME